MFQIDKPSNRILKLLKIKINENRIRKHKDLKRDAGNKDESSQKNRDQNHMFQDHLNAYGVKSLPVIQGDQKICYNNDTCKQKLI